MTALEANEYRENLVKLSERTVEATRTHEPTEEIPLLLIHLCGITTMMTQVLIDIAEQKGG